METRLISLDPQAPDPLLVQEAAAVLRSGGLVAFPTETVYGLGANAMNGEALAKIFVAKERPTSDPIIAHIARVEQLTTLAARVPPVAWDLAERFWPGPLTLILERHPSVPSLIAEGRETVAIRMPSHAIARALLEAAETPVGAPSANRFTRPSATRAAHVVEDLGGRIDMIIDGGSASIGVESTVLDLTSSVPRVLRPGGLTLEAIQEVLPGTEFAPVYKSESEGHQSPGQLLKHYSPRASVRLFRGADREKTLGAMLRMVISEQAAGRKVGVLLTNEEASDFGDSVESVLLGPEGDPALQAKSLFAALRRLDEQQVDLILVREPPREGLGRALADRLLRAAVGQVIDC